MIKIPMKANDNKNNNPKGIYMPIDYLQARQTFTPCGVKCTIAPVVEVRR